MSFYSSLRIAALGEGHQGSGQTGYLQFVVVDLEAETP
jgi:hypothetical protein